MYNWCLLLFAYFAVFHPISSLSGPSLVDGRQQSCNQRFSRDTRSSYGNFPSKVTFNEQLARSRSENWNQIHADSVALNRNTRNREIFRTYPKLGAPLQEYRRMNDRVGARNIRETETSERQERRVRDNSELSTREARIGRDLATEYTSYRRLDNRQVVNDRAEFQRVRSQRSISRNRDFKVELSQNVRGSKERRLINQQTRKERIQSQREFLENPNERIIESNRKNQLGRINVSDLKRRESTLRDIQQRSNDNLIRSDRFSRTRRTSMEGLRSIRDEHRSRSEIRDSTKVDSERSTELRVRERMDFVRKPHSHLSTVDIADSNREQHSRNKVDRDIYSMRNNERRIVKDNIPQRLTSRVEINLRLDMNRERRFERSSVEHRNINVVGSRKNMRENVRDITRSASLNDRQERGNLERRNSNTHIDYRRQNVKNEDRTIHIRVNSLERRMSNARIESRPQNRDQANVGRTTNNRERHISERRMSMTQMDSRRHDDQNERRVSHVREIYDLERRIANMQIESRRQDVKTEDQKRHIRENNLEKRTSNSRIETRRQSHKNEGRTLHVRERANVERRMSIARDSRRYSDKNEDEIHQTREKGSNERILLDRANREESRQNSRSLSRDRQFVQRYVDSRSGFANEKRQQPIDESIRSRKYDQGKITRNDERRFVEKSAIISSPHSESQGENHWPYLMYTIHGIYICSIILPLMLSVETSKQSTKWGGNYLKLLKVD